MTLQEARECLDLQRGATVDEIRRAFRRRARIVHPDRHPGAGPEELRTLEAEFDRAREACDILVRYTQDPRRAPFPEPAPQSARPAGGSAPRPTQTPSPPPPPPPQPSRRRAEPRPAPHPHAAPAPLSYDEFVAWWDAAGFGPGARSTFRIAWGRVAAWTAVGACVIAVGGAIVWDVVGR